MTISRDLTDEQAYWLKRVLESRPRQTPPDQFSIPTDVHDVLIDKGFIRRHRGAVEITLDGIREVARRPPEPG